MATQVTQEAFDYATKKLSGAGIRHLMTNLDPSYPNAQELALLEITNADPTDLGAICQLLLLLRQRKAFALMKDFTAALKRLLSCNLKHDGAASSAVHSIVSTDFPELAKYKNGGMSYAYLRKNVNDTTLIAMAATLSHPEVAVAAIMGQMQHTSWMNFGRDWGFDEDEYLIQAEHAVLKRFADAGSSRSIQEGCALFPAGPYAAGFINPVTNNTTVTSTAAAPAAAPTFTTTTTTNGATTMTTATTSNASSITSLNAVYKPIIDNMFSQSGLTVTMDQIIADVVAKASLEAQLESAEKMAADTIDGLKRQLASASSAMPSTISITAHSTVTPSGTMTMVEASTIFPLMAGLKFKVPQFTWAHAHPDVPEVNGSYIFRKEMLLKALRCLTKGENFWLSGHTGSGKTTFVEQIASRLGWPVARVAFDSNVDRSELVGRMSLAGDGKGGTTSSWLPGILETAITNGYILLCDEMDAGHPNALYTLQPLLEGKPLTLLEDGGRLVPRSPMARICATGNTTGNGDPSGLYPACRILSAATLDRFQTFINVPYMTLDEEINLVSSSVPTLAKKLVGRLAKFAGEMRNAFVTNQTPISYSPRRSVAFAREVEDMFSMGFKDEKEVLSAAFKSKLYDAASEEFRQRITEIASATLGGIDPTKGIQ